MSRCFPFPPPGYEKKGTTNYVDLLEKEMRKLHKETHREKKHKKEKRDKEKKESKDKRKKERSEGKDREKKDKEKRGDNSKDKEKNDNKDKYKSSITAEDENKLAWKPVVHTGEILGKNGKNGFSNKGKASGTDFGNSEEKLFQNNHQLVRDMEHSKSAQDSGREIGDGDRGPIQNFTGTDRKKEEKTVVKLVTKDFGNGLEAKDKNRDRFDGPGSRVMPESYGNTMLPNFPGFDQGKFEGKPGPIEKSIGRKAEGRSKTTKERDDKHGERDREKKSKGKDKKSEKEKKKEVKCDEKTKEQDKFKGEKNGYIGRFSDNMPAFVKDGDMASEIHGQLRKRKDLEENGVLLGSGQVPEVPDGGFNPHVHPDANINLSKLPYPPSILSSHSLVQNGKATDPCQTPLTSGAISMNLVVDEKKLKVYGMVEGHPVPASSSKPVPTSWKPKKITPHPDCKYLDEVLSVPKMAEWSEFDDQEWLLCGNETSLKKPRINDFCVNESPEVWDKALLIDSADVYALPYVIPY